MELVSQFVAGSRESDETIAAAQQLMRDAFAAYERSDVVLKRHARHWQLGRLAMVDRNILRLAIYEMLERCIPPKVVIAESLRLAQEFSTAESPRFINGILDAVYRELREHTAERARPADDAPQAPEAPADSAET